MQGGEINLMLTHQILDLLFTDFIFIQAIGQQRPTRFNFNLLKLTEDPLQAADTQEQKRKIRFFTMATKEVIGSAFVVVKL